jgi:hypothetical protein
VSPLSRVIDALQRHQDFHNARRIRDAEQIIREVRVWRAEDAAKGIEWSDR